MCTKTYKQETGPKQFRLKLSVQLSECVNIAHGPTYIKQADRTLNVLVGRPHFDHVKLEYYILGPATNRQYIIIVLHFIATISEILIGRHAYDF